MNIVAEAATKRAQCVYAMWDEQRKGVEQEEEKKNQACWLKIDQAERKKKKSSLYSQNGKAQLPEPQPKRKSTDRVQSNHTNLHIYLYIYKTEYTDERYISG